MTHSNESCNLTKLPVVGRMMELPHQPALTFLVNRFLNAHHYGSLPSQLEVVWYLHLNAGTGGTISSIFCRVDCSILTA